MSTWHHVFRLSPVAALMLFSGVSTPVAAQSAPAPPATSGAASLLPKDPLWVVNLDPLPQRVAADEESDPVATLRKFTYLAVLGYDGEWARVLNPRTSEVGFIPSDEIGPVDAPPPYLTADPPPAIDELDVVGRTLRNASLTYYPTSDPDAQTDTLSLNTQVTITQTVEGDDGETWYRTSEGDYLPEAAVRLPRPPPRTFAGHW